jgi:hypothetical protein
MKEAMLLYQVAELNKIERASGRGQAALPDPQIGLPWVIQLIQLRRSGRGACPRPFE